MDPVPIHAVCDLCGQRGPVRIMDAICRLKVGNCCAEDVMRAHHALLSVEGIRHPHRSEITEEQNH